MSKLVLELSDAVKLSADGKSFVLNSDAEESIAKLLSYKEQIEKAIELVKKEIAKQGVALNAGFSGVRGSKVQASYRHFGQPFKIVAKNIERDLSPDLYVKSVSYRPSTTGIEEYFDAKGKLPDGIVPNTRDKVISLKLIEGKQ